jgi:hypothetical protein
VIFPIKSFFNSHKVLWNVVVARGRTSSFHCAANLIGADGATALAQALQINTRLTLLELRCEFHLLPPNSPPPFFTPGSVICFDCVPLGPPSTRAKIQLNIKQLCSFGLTLLLQTLV